MRWPRPRFSMRWLLVFVSAVAVALGVVREFGEGLPPRFIVRDIPRRIKQLRSGMTREQVWDILGLDRSWLLGGTGPTGEMRIQGNGYMEWGRYNVRAPRNVALDYGSGVQFYNESSAMIHLTFRCDPKTPGYMSGEYPFLDAASFCSDGQTIAEMPKSPRADP